MLELTAVTLHAFYSMPRPLTCPRAKVWLRRYHEPMREAAVPELAEVVLDFANAATPSSLTMLFVFVVLIAKYITARRS